MLWRFRQYLSRHLGISNTQWARVEMDRRLEAFFDALDCASLSALEISGTKWADRGFKEYKSISFPEYDVCAGPYRPSAYDVVIAEQVFEHVLWPYRAVKSVHAMLRPAGVFLISTPFLLRIHNHPVDCSRWTELGIKHLLAEGGFNLEDIETGSWGNRSCVVGNFRRWPNYNSWFHSLRHEPDFPVVVWAMATKR